MSSEDTEVAIVGAGMAGVACARRLADAGVSAVILDKGRGIGGRMATRRVALDGGELRFDHGAQYVTARNEDFARQLAAIPEAVAVWDDGAPHPHYVGVPGMSGLPRAMAVGLDVRQSAEVTDIRRTGGGWQVMAGELTLCAPRLVLALPAPQAARLLGGVHGLGCGLETVEMAPCLTLMAAFPPDCPRPFVGRIDETHPLAWVARDNSKPGRPAIACTWVAQASPGWSREHLEEDRDAVAARLLPLLGEVLGVSPERALYASAHRWRYARVTRSLGRPFLGGSDDGLYFGGDWCLGARVEAAWQSGDAVARDILNAGPDRRPH